MARIARVVAPGFPHHVTQRGNRRQPVFFSDEDYQAYRELMSEWCGKMGVAVWAYCLMPNHVHLLVVPKSADGLRRAVGEAHRLYTRRVNFREGWRGYLWQGRFASCVMDQPHLLAVVRPGGSRQAARYIEMNPVRARLVRRPEAWPWSSARAHLAGDDDGLVQASALLSQVVDWKAFLHAKLPDEWLRRLRQHQRTGRPLGDLNFLKKLERRLARPLLPQKPGRKPKTREDGLTK